MLLADRARRLLEIYGWRFLAMIAVSQFVLRGFVFAYLNAALGYIFRAYAVDSATLQVYKSGRRI